MCLSYFACVSGMDHVARIHTCHSLRRMTSIGGPNFTNDRGEHVRIAVAVHITIPIEGNAEELIRRRPFHLQAGWLTTGSTVIG